MLDDENFFVNIFHINDSKIKSLNQPVYSAIIEIITDDKEALDLALNGLTKWFKDMGLTSKKGLN
jgi:hypothetical protein